MGRPGHDLRRWNSLGAPLVPVAEDDRELKISPAVSPMRDPAGSARRVRVPDVRRGQPERVIGHRRAAGASGDFRGPTPGLAVPEPRVPAIGAGSVNRRLPGTSGTPSQRRAIDRRRAQKTRGPRVPEPLPGAVGSMLRAAAAQKRRRERLGVPPLMPPVLQVLGRLRCAMSCADRRRFFLSGVAARARGTVFSPAVSAHTGAVFATVETRKKNARRRFRFRSRDFRFQRLTTFPFATQTNPQSGGWSCVPAPSWTRGSARTRTRTR